MRNLAVVSPSVLPNISSEILITFQQVKPSNVTIHNQIDTDLNFVNCLRVSKKKLCRVPLHETFQWL